MAHIVVVYYSAYGHVLQMAQAAATGAAAVEGCTSKLVRIPEFAAVENRTPYLDSPARRRQTQGEDGAVALEETFNTQARFEKYEAALRQQQHIPVATLDDLREADGIIWGFPTYYGCMPAQVKLFLDHAGELCLNGDLEGKPTSVFTSTGSIHTGHEAAILTAIVPLLHFGMIYVGMPYGDNPEYLTADPIGCSPYGASTLAGPDSGRYPDDRELAMMSRLAGRVAVIASRLRQ